MIYARKQEGDLLHLDSRFNTTSQASSVRAGQYPTSVRIPQFNFNSLLGHIDIVRAFFVDNVFRNIAILERGLNQICQMIL